MQYKLLLQNLQTTMDSTRRMFISHVKNRKDPRNLHFFQYDYSLILNTWLPSHDPRWLVLLPP